jgi:hypothetical protein
MALSLFVIPQLVVKAATKETKIDSSLIYLLFASVMPLLWIFLPNELRGIREVNFLQHAVGGGVAVGFVALYLIVNLKEIFPLLKKFPVQVLFIYLLVSGFGAANELLEFFLDFVEVGIFSADRYDTWFDLFANTTGAFVVYLLFKLVNLFHKN